jgi:eukaryotic-like serine/threonine-protein kinase
MGDSGHSTVKLPMPDQIIAGRYRIISRLGSGGMGLVFLAEQLGVGNKVALKFLDPEPSTDETRAARFLREAKVALEVQHPGATQILDLGRDEAMRLFMCFELVEGEDLREVIKREGRIRFGEARSICVQVAQVLAFAHERSIVHRDVKPENLRVRRDLGLTHVKVLDFGIARLLKDTGLRLTGEGMLAGTPRYMAPEQVKDEPIDGRIDQYALGLVFFEMLTGAVAIGGKNITQILMHQIKTLVPPLAWVDPQLAHPAIDAFIAKACAKDPLDRYASMADFVVALQALQVDERSWPEPKAPPANPGSSTAQTREGAPQPSAAKREGESDTFVRVPVQTHQERRLEVATEPDGVEPVARKPAVEPTTDPVQQQAPAPPQQQGRRTAHPALELPTDPERPMVSRGSATIASRKGERDPSRRKIVGASVPPAPAPAAEPSRMKWWLLGAVIGLISLGAAGFGWWWKLHH